MNTTLETAESDIYIYVTWVYNGFLRVSIVFIVYDHGIQNTEKSKKKIQKCIFVPISQAFDDKSHALVEDARH